MKCLHPISVVIADKEAGRFYDHALMQVPCGKCAACLHNKRSEWVMRLSERQRVATTAYFVTLTYDDNHLFYYSESDWTPTLYKPHVKEFLHKLINKGQSRWQNELKRKGMSYKERKSNRVKIDYFLVGEYGDDFDRPHYHFVIFDYPTDRETLTLDCQQVWNKQTTIVDVRYASGPLINYLTKYMLKDDDVDYNAMFVISPFRLMSKGIGKSFVSDAAAIRYAKTGNYVSSIGNAKYAIPRYLRDKLDKCYYSKLGINPNDDDFYYALHADRYQNAKAQQVASSRLMLKLGISVPSADDVEWQLKYHNKVIKQSKKLRKK